MTHMTDMELLEAVLDLLSEPTRWTRKAFARNQRGTEVPPQDDEAICWCLQGAVIHFWGKRRDPPESLVKAGREISSWGLHMVNDNFTHEDVLNCVRRAIVIERERLAIA